jgi:peptidoglycan/LPS O-acetylase OafA/YrhL
LQSESVLNGRNHIDELQSLRGVAALVVAISHISYVYPLPVRARFAIDAVCNAHACIVVFFVLSGYVLTGSLIRRGLSWQSIKLFYLARVLRLFPALWVASAISAVSLWLLPSGIIHPAPSYWFLPYLHPFPSPGRLVLAALAVDWSLIMPVWTVFIEIVGSAVMPLFVAASLARHRLFLWALAGFGLSTWWLVYAPHRLDALVYLFDFGLGVILASGRWKFFSNHLPWKLAGGVIVLVFFRFVYLAIRFGHVVPLYIGYLYPEPLLVEGVSAFVVVGALASEHGRVGFLRSRGAVWLGNVSYSLYLIHFPVATMNAKLLSRFLTDATGSLTAMTILLATTLPISLAAALLIYRFVELPSIALAKVISRRVTPRALSVKV